MASTTEDKKTCLEVLHHGVSDQMGEYVDSHVTLISLKEIDCLKINAELLKSDLIK